MPRPKASPIVAALLAAALAACGGDASDEEIPYADDGKLTVMTQNLFLGAHLYTMLPAQTPQELVAAWTAAWQRVNANDFRARGAAIADEIARALPDVVGLQEVSLWRTQSPGDAAAGGTTPATTVAFDFLRILLDDLAQRGLRYEAVRVLDLMDVEAPIATGMDLRLTDRQAILVRSGLPAANARGQAFSPATLMSVSVLGTTRSILRGWTAVDVTIGGRRIAFYDTHLQSFDAGASTAQAGELAGILASEAGPVVLVGDLNSAPGTEGHAAMMAAGFTDAWSTVHPSDAGLTCCWPEDLTQTSPPLHARVDLVLTRGDLTPTSATVVGEELGDRTATHLWPSDHAGVVATIEP